MDCPNCKTVMEEGALVLHGTIWAKKKASNRSLFGLKIVSNGVGVSAFRCPNCKKIELRAQDN